VTYPPDSTSTKEPEQTYPPYPTYGGDDDYPTDTYPTDTYPTDKYPTDIGDKNPTETCTTDYAYPTGKYPDDKYPVDKYPTDKYPVDKYPTDKYPTDKYPVDKYPVDKYPVDTYPTEPCTTDLAYPTGGPGKNPHKPTTCYEVTLTYQPTSYPTHKVHDDKPIVTVTTTCYEIDHTMATYKPTAAPTFPYKPTSTGASKPVVTAGAVGRFEMAAVGSVFGAVLAVAALL